MRPNHVEIETGYLNTSADGVGNTVTYPQTLIRIGTAVPALELQTGKYRALGAGISYYL